jgi:hypothetical protein
MSTYTKPTLQRYGSFREVTRYLNGVDLCHVIPWFPKCGTTSGGGDIGGGTGDSGLGDGFQDRS